MTKAGRYRLVLLALVILGLWIAAAATGVTRHFTSAGIRGVLAGRGLWGVAAFAGLYTAGEFIHVPGPVFVAAAAAVYGTLLGIPVALVAALVSVSVSFVVVRTIGGEPLTEVHLPLVRRLLSKIDTHPVLAVASLRLIFQTASPINYALAMTSVRFRDYLAGSVLGLPVPVALMVVFFHWVLHRGI